ncbi:MAG: hypothetical protein KAI83_10220 [Thiomargarita sp.]|nr:hypothetical protein [Thiomargarita sp.]
MEFEVQVFLSKKLEPRNLIKNSQQGITIQFDVMLIVALLELHLKQEAMDIVSAKKSTTERNKQKEKTSKNSEKENLTSSCQEFIEILGKNVNKYWKIGRHWLTALRNRLSSPFDEKAIEVLGMA